MAMIKWTVELSIDESFVAEGFELDNERALEMFAQYVRYAHNAELDAVVISEPDIETIAALQGYATLADYLKAS